MNLLLGMRRGDGVDLLDDDLLEEFLDLGVGLLMLGPGHQAAVIEAMQQVIDRLPAQAHAEFLLQDAAQVLAAEGADAILGGGPGLEAVSEPRHIRRGQAGWASGVGPLLEGRQAPLVVAADPGLNGAVRASQGPGDRGGGMALLGQHDGLMTQPDPFLREGFGQSLKFFEAVMVLDKHRSSSWCDSDAQSILPNRHNPWNRSARIFRTWYKGLLDTDILSELFKGVNPSVGRTASAYRQAFGHLTLSAITVMEIVSSLQRMQSPRRIQKFMNNISGEEVLPFDKAAGKLAGEIAGDLERTGQSIGIADPMIAAVALQRGLELVTGNTAHFQRIQQLGYPLTLANWRQ